MPFNKICRVCGRPFVAKRQRNKVCSPECHRATKIEAARRQKKKRRICQVCGKEFVSKWSGRRGNIVCSEECRREAIARSKRKGNYVACEVCGKMTWKRPYNLSRARHYYCGEECHQESMRHRWWDTKLELAIAEMDFPGVIKTSGRKLCIDVGGKRSWNPDFVVEPLDKTRKVIEAFGRNWHNEEDAKRKIETYAKAGYDCLIVWENEVKDGSFIVKVQEFLADKAPGA